MTAVNPLAVIVAAIAGFVLGALWYGPVLFGGAYARLRATDSAAAASAQPPVGEIAAELARCLVVASVLAHFLALLGASGWLEAAATAILLWLGFQAMAIAGSVIHEGYPWRLFAIHAGDALVKTVLMATILAAWRG